MYELLERKSSEELERVSEKFFRNENAARVASNDAAVAAEDELKAIKMLSAERDRMGEELKALKKVSAERERVDDELKALKTLSAERERLHSGELLQLQREKLDLSHTLQQSTMRVSSLESELTSLNSTLTSQQQQSKQLMNEIVALNEKLSTEVFNNERMRSEQVCTTA